MQHTRKTTAILTLMATLFVAACSPDAAVAPLAPTAPSLDITLDMDAGTGFVGKGDVQTFFGYNNPQMQAVAATVEFRIRAETEWTCSKPHPVHDYDIVQERSTGIRSVSTVIGRTNSQGTNGPWTGFILTLGSTQTTGPAVGSCPDDNSGFSYDDNAVTTGGLQIRQNSGSTAPKGQASGTWYDFAPLTL